MLHSQVLDVLTMQIYTALKKYSSDIGLNWLAMIMPMSYTA